MFKFLNSRVGLLWAILCSLLAGCIYMIIVKSCVLVDYDNLGLFHSFFVFLKEHKIYRVCILILNLLLQLFLLSYYLSETKLVQRGSLYPAIFYLAFLLVTKSFWEVTPLLFTNTFLILILLLNNYYDNEFRIKKSVFYTSMLIALGCCFDLSFIMVMLFVIISLIINLFSKMRHIAILLFAFLMCSLYIFSFYFLTDTISALVDYVSTISPFLFFDNFDSLPLHRWLFLLLGLCFIVIIMVVVSFLFENRLIVMRKKVFSLHILFFCQLLALLLTNFYYPNFLQYFVVPISITLSLLVTTSNRSFVSEFFVFVVILCLCV